MLVKSSVVIVAVIVNRNFRASLMGQDDLRGSSRRQCGAGGWKDPHGVREPCRVRNEIPGDHLEQQGLPRACEVGSTYSLCAGHGPAANGCARGTGTTIPRASP